MAAFFRHVVAEHLLAGNQSRRVRGFASFLEISICTAFAERYRALLEDFLGLYRSHQRDTKRLVRPKDYARSALVAAPPLA
jgi:hypothetical protein